MLGLYLILCGLMWMGVLLVFLSLKQIRTKLKAEDMRKIDCKKAKKNQSNMKKIFAVFVALLGITTLRLFVDSSLKLYSSPAAGKLTEMVISAIDPIALVLWLTTIAGFCGSYMLFKHAQYIVNRCDAFNFKTVE